MSDYTPTTKEERAELKRLCYVLSQQPWCVGASHLEGDLQEVHVINANNVKRLLYSYPLPPDQAAELYKAVCNVQTAAHAFPDVVRRMIELEEQLEGNPNSG